MSRETVSDFCRKTLQIVLNSCEIKVLQSVEARRCLCSTGLNMLLSKLQENTGGMREPGRKRL